VIFLIVVGIIGYAESDLVNSTDIGGAVEDLLPEIPAGDPGFFVSVSGYACQDNSR